MENYLVFIPKLKANILLSSVKLFERVGKYNPCVGAFLEDDTLASWVFR